MAERTIRLNAVPSLRRRLLLRLLVPLFALFGISGVCAYWLAVHYSSSIYDHWLYDSVNSLALLVSPGPHGAQADLPVAVEKVFVWDETDPTLFNVTGAQSGVLVSNADLPPVPDDAERYVDGFFYDGVLADGERVRVAALPLSADRAGEPVWVKVAETGTERADLIEHIFLAVLAPQLLLITAAFFAVRRGVVDGLLPLRRLTRRLRAQGPQALQPLADAGVPEEVRPLTQALNGLLGRLNALFDTHRKFIADTAHQLRTPLTAIKLNIEEALAENDIERTHAHLLRLRASADRATRLTTQLLSLARAESGAGLPDRFQKIDLARLAHECGAAWVPRALAKQIELSLHRDDAPVWVRGDPLLLREAVDNLIDNAIQYHPGHGQIRLDVRATPEPRLSVEDDGPGIAPELRSVVFGRFQRGDQTGRGGTGLGLAIVSEIAATHRGRVWLEDTRSGRGIRAVLELPPPRDG